MCTTFSKLQNKNLVIILTAILIISLLPIHSSLAVSVSLSFPTSPSDGNLSSSASTSVDPQIIISGTNVFLVWEEDTDNKIRFIRSTDSGTNFASSVEIGDATSGTSGFQQISASSNDVYAV